MELPPKPTTTPSSSSADPWKQWAADLERMGAASRRADDEFLRNLSLEDGLRLFEDLCEDEWGLEGPFDDDPPPVPLARLWRDPR